MDFIDPIVTIAEKLHALCTEVKANKERCTRLDQRVAALVKVVEVVKVSGLGPHPELVKKGLRELKGTLMSAQKVVANFISTGCLKRIRKAFKLGEQFESLNERLNDAAQLLSLALQADQRQQLENVFQEVKRMREDAADREVDHRDLEKILQSLEDIKESVDSVHDVVESTSENVKDIKALLESLKKPSIQLMDIQEIEADKLTYSFPKVPIVKSATSELFKGEYKKFTVAIKRFTCHSTPDEIRKIFNKEVETMRRFESPNILRMFGICIKDADGPCPDYLIVMEFCEKGSLREVLDGPSRLSWERRACMSLDAAQAIYRLHQSETKFKVHGSICSSKFLVDAGYTVKLGGFELAKTETSLKNNKKKEGSSINYCSPQQIEDVNYLYDRDCEIYSFGIVLWEIATRQIPFKGCKSTEIYQKVCKEKSMEPLPADCPKNLVDIINACRAYEPFYRPPARVLVDKLRDVVQELDD
ncbi:mixed lineage kinase domain-like protein [Brienomyrus brachyistius]|uniref:mixed lineage kinase domain-like protein n=1 Tax=Brienomyrus brachyistius TaxID=42636 RepID=UPI0020B23512|nr:mixed lineage kinase domain-like protein [Brienomyrus brachyistius]XP_048885984.1 mixed lineage kinase domain-like protein [Brienomyrus brachyistius]XP_048885985.1 mixed lineage kinase domain-like protein [Brienomyrus brachyistius]